MPPNSFFFLKYNSLNNVEGKSSLRYDKCPPYLMFRKKNLLFQFLLSSIYYIGRNYWNCENFQLPVPNGICILRCPEHDLIIFTKCLPASLCVCDTNCVAWVAQKLIDIAFNFVLSCILT